MADAARDLLKTEDYLALLESAKTLNRITTLEEALGEILAQAAKLAESTAGSVLLHDPEQEDLYFAAVIGDKADDVKAHRVPIEGSIAGKVLDSGQALTESNIREHYDAVDADTGFKSRSMICVPLIHGERKMGVMQLLNKGDGAEPYGARDLELLTRFGEQAAIAIANADLYEKLVSSCGLFAREAIRAPFVPLLVSPDSEPVKDDFVVLFADIRGFTKLCTSQRPEQIKAFLDEYFTVLTDEVVKRDGIVNKLVGDGLLAIFGGKKQVAHAARAAFAIVRRFHNLRSVWDEDVRENLDFLDIGVGLARDELVLGRVGRASCFDFTVIGHGVNFASALCERARDGKRILCDQFFYKALRRDKELRWVQSEKLEPVNLIQIDKKFDAHHLKLEPTHYDVFMSYRRKGGGEAAHALRGHLAMDVFLDVDSLRSGRYEAVLEKTIATTPHFVVLLTKGSLDRCNEPGDWLTREIQEAIEAKRNIVPVTWPDFKWPDKADLPEGIRALPEFQAVPYSHEGFVGTTIPKLRKALATAK